MFKKLIWTLLALFVVAGALGACGSDGEDSESSADAQEADREFIAGMVPHHESAIDMAEVAQEQGENPEVRRLADDIVSAQEAEIADLRAAHERIFGEPLADQDEMSGMEADVDALRGAKPFDREFIDMMIPHHQEAILMARTELAEGEDPELQEIATAVIDAQSREIDEMNSWREEWYGAPSPAGGVPAEDEESSMDEMPGM